MDHESYVFDRDISNIPAKAFLEAKPYGISGYAWANITEQGIKQAIYYAKTKRQGVVMLMKVGDTFWIAPDGTVTWNKDKILPLRVPKTITSGHEVYPIGYEYINGRLAIHFLNSWSADWGDNGKGWFYFDEWQNLIPEIMTSVDKTDVPTNTFSKNLSYGMSDPDVKKLQQFLNSHGFTVSYAGAGSVGKETDFFGILTKKAVIKLQAQYNLPQTGYFGPMTRQVVNKLV